MIGFLPINFRFRNKIRLLLDIYYCMLEEKDKALHPNQIAKKRRDLGMSLDEVAEYVRSFRYKLGPEEFKSIDKFRALLALEDTF